MRDKLPNALSLSRIGIAPLVLLVYSPADQLRFSIAVIAIVIAILTDLVDGPLARRWGISSESGYIFDGLGDRSFYVGLILIFVAYHNLHIVVAWIVILREIAMYALRLVMSRAWFTNNPAVRSTSLLHAASIRSWFFTYFFSDALNLFAGIDLESENLYLMLRLLLLVSTILTGYISIYRLSQQALFSSSKTRST